MNNSEQMSFEEFEYSEEAMAEAWAASIQGMQALEQAARGSAVLDPATIPLGSEITAGQGSPLSVAPSRPSPPPGERAANPVRSPTRAAVLTHPSKPAKGVVPCGGEAGTLANLSQDMWEEQQSGLIQFVERLAQIYGLNRKELPPCWLDHPNLVAEFHALWRLHHSQYNSNESKGMGPSNFHQALHSLRYRLSEGLESPKCEQGIHIQDDFDRRVNVNREIRFEHYRAHGVKGPIGGWKWPEITWSYNPDVTEDPHNTGEGK